MKKAIVCLISLVFMFSVVSQVMALDISLHIPDEDISDLAEYWGWKPMVSDENLEVIPNPESAKDFVIRRYNEYGQNAIGAKKIKNDTDTRASRLSGLAEQKAKYTGKEIK